MKKPTSRSPKSPLLREFHIALCVERERKARQRDATPKWRWLRRRFLESELDALDSILNAIFTMR